MQQQQPLSVIGRVVAIGNPVMHAGLHIVVVRFIACALERLKNHSPVIKRFAGLRHPHAANPRVAGQTGFRFDVHDLLFFLLGPLRAL